MGCRNGHWRVLIDMEKTAHISNTAGRISLDDFLAELDSYTERVPLDRLTALLRRLDVSLDDVIDCARFNDERYQRNLLRSGSAYHALILCWRNGQRSPIHDHRGSSCGVRVLKGVMTETLFEVSANGLIFATSSSELKEHSVCGSQDSDIHQVSNLQPDGRDLITLHIYSPPLHVMGTYSLISGNVGEFADPVFEFCHGDGI